MTNKTTRKRRRYACGVLRIITSPLAIILIAVYAIVVGAAECFDCLKTDMESYAQGIAECFKASRELYPNGGSKGDD